MKLSAEQIAACAAGVYTARPLPDGCRFHRLPPTLWRLYDDGGGLAARAACSTGVRLRFRSNTRRLRVTWRYGEPVRWYFLGVMAVDGERRDAFGPVSRQASWSGCLFEQPEPVAHTFDLWLPHLCPAEVAAIALDDGAAFEPLPPPARTWLAFGDSITQGMNASLPVFAWTARAALALDANLLNFGVGGATFDPVLADAVAETPDCRWVTVAYGANDFNMERPVDVMAGHAAGLLDALRRRHPAARRVLITPIPFFRQVPRNTQGATLDDYRGALAAVAASTGAACIDGTDLVPADPVFFNDRSHPNDAGMQAYSQNLLTRLERLAE